MVLNSQNNHYNHEEWEFRRRILRFLIKNLGVTLLAKLDKVEGIENLPEEGSGILLINHTAFVDSLIMVHAMPRHIVPLAKSEVYNYPFVGIFPKLWGVVPINRDEIDRKALQRILSVLHAGELILIAPEGTRHESLHQGRVGIAYLASRSGSPVIPVAIQGSPGFPTFRTSKRWREPGIHIKVGRPFKYRSDLSRARKGDLRLMTDEAMYVLASMLPERLRGVYADLTKATQQTIEWI
jgi:1-acyl-sn-glycerol-3-phosphate acyltransferase